MSPLQLRFEKEQNQKTDTTRNDRQKKRIKPTLLTFWLRKEQCETRNNLPLTVCKPFRSLLLHIFSHLSMALGGQDFLL